MHRPEMLSVSAPRSRLLSAGRAAPDEDDIRVCSAILASVVSLMVLCGVLSALPNPGVVPATKAYVVLGIAAIMLVLMLLAWILAPGIRALAAPRAPAPAQTAPAAAAAAPVRLARRLCACGLADAAGVAAALPAFPYGEDDDEAAASASASPRPRRSGVLCAVCLEDVRAGEMVRQLPACRHLFHVGCVDAWLRAHRTCPLCRCELPPRKAGAGAGASGTAAVVVAAVAAGLPMPPV